MSLHYTVDTGTAKAMAVAIVGSRLDYCNSVLYGMSQAHINRLQRVQNILARVVARASWTVSSLDIRRDLHWLPVSHCINFKLCFTHLENTPHCLSSVPVRTSHPLPSTQSLTLFQHKSSGQTYRYH